MTLLNLTVLGAHRPHIPWIVVQVQTGLTSALFSKIAAGTHPRLVVDEELSRSRLDKVFVGHTKDSLSTVDKQLIIDFCAMFSQHVKYTVTLPTPREVCHNFRSQPSTKRVCDYDGISESNRYGQVAT